MISMLCLLVLGGGHCYQQRVVAYQQVYAVPYTVNYFVGQPLREQALAVKALQDDPDYAEFKKFKEWKAFSQQKLQQQQPEAPVKPIATMLNQKCAKCHSGDKPEKGYLFDGSAPLDPDSVVKAMKAIDAGKMPKGTKLTPEEAGQLFQELLDLSESKEPLPPPPPPQQGELK